MRSKILNVKCNSVATSISYVTSKLNKIMFILGPIVPKIKQFSKDYLILFMPYFITLSYFITPINKTQYQNKSDYP